MKTSHLEERLICGMSPSVRYGSEEGIEFTSVYFATVLFHALRASNAIALVMLFLCGYWLGRYAGHRPWRMGFAMVVVGSVLVALTIALGG